MKFKFVSLALALGNLPTFRASPITTPHRSPNLQPLRGDLLSPQAALCLSGFAGAVAPPGHPPCTPLSATLAPCLSFRTQAKHHPLRKLSLGTGPPLAGALLPVSCDIHGLCPQVFQRLVCLACLPPRQTRACQAWRTALRTRRRNRHENRGTPSGSHPPLWATRVSLSHISSPDSRENRGQEGRGRKEERRGPRRPPPSPASLPNMVWKSVP